MKLKLFGNEEQDSLENVDVSIKGSEINSTSCIEVYALKMFYLNVTEGKN